MIARQITLLLTLSLVACTATAPAPEPAQLSAGARAECRLLVTAFDQTKQRTGETRPSIVEGCPGFENVVVRQNRFQASGGLLGAAATPLPADASAQGRLANIVFRRMIVRGVPQEIANGLARSPQFAATVAALEAQ